MWCWRRMEKTSWTDHVGNEEVLLRVNEKRNIIHEIRKWKANWIGHILRRNCLLKQVIEGKIKGEMEATRRRGWRREKLLDDLKDRRGYSHLNEEALDRTMWRNRFGGGFGPVVRQNTEWMNNNIYYIIIPDMFRAIPCSSSGGQILLQPLSTPVESGLQSALNRCTEWLLTESDDTRWCNDTIWPPEDEHGIARNMSIIIM